MKKVLALLMALAMILCVVACSDSSDDDTADTGAESSGDSGSDTGDSGDADSGEVMTHAEFVAAEEETQVTVETYVQAKQSWWDGAGTFYTQSEDGAYFIYEMACTEDEYDSLTQGTKIRVTGNKTSWSGEVEIVDATWEIIDGNYIAEPVDVTDLLGTDELIDHQNELVSFKGMTVEDYDGSGAAFAYKNDTRGEDIYFKVSLNGETYEFCVESYLTGEDTDVYQGIEALSVGDVVDLEGFLYWYNGANPHIISVSAA